MTRRTVLVLAAAALLLAGRWRADAQTLADGPIVYGHHHLNVTSLDEHKKFWVDTLGGTVTTFGANKMEIIKFPNVLLFMRQQKPTGGTRGTTVNHIGFSVPNLRPVVDKIKANGFQMITRSEVAATQEVTDDIAVLNPNTSIAFALGPDDVKVELVQVKQQTVPIALHHVHFFGEHNLEMRDWYVKVFGAQARPVTGVFATAALPGLALNFSPSPTPVVGTKGRSLDHIGFEIKNLEEFCRKLEAMGIKLDVPYRSVPALGIAIAFVTDPWGTSIELNEGLGTIQ
jgi:catechol 2,3-dioxygenase-like lactoylglutathione lyase family enzyme